MELNNIFLCNIYFVKLLERLNLLSKRFILIFTSKTLSINKAFFSRFYTFGLLSFRIKDVMQGKLIAVVYTLRTYWNQFSLGGICKQEYMHQRSSSIRGGTKHLILIIHIHSFLWPEYFIDYFCENGFLQAVTSVLCLLFRPKTVHYSKKMRTPLK